MIGKISGEHFMAGINLAPGNLIFWHGGNTVALIIDIMYSPNEHADAWWVTLLDEDGIFDDDLAEGFTIVDEKWNWPSWHTYYKQN